MKTPYEYRYTPRHYNADGTVNYDGSPLYVEKGTPILDAIIMGFDLAREFHTDVLFAAFAPAVKWQHLHTLHPDGTATDAFGNHLRFTGNALRFWDKVKE